MRHRVVVGPDESEERMSKKDAKFADAQLAHALRALRVMPPTFGRGVARAHVAEILRRVQR